MGRVVALVVVVVLLAAAADEDIDHTVTGMFNVGVWIALIGGGFWLWSKVQEMSEGNAKATQAKARSAVNDEVRAWLTAGEKARRQRPRPPSPIRPPAVENTGTGLPASDLARRAIMEVVAGLTRCVADEARGHAGAVRPPVERLCQPGSFRERDDPDFGDWGPSREGTRPTEEAFDLVVDMFAWADARRALLSSVDQEAARLLAETMNPLGNKLQEFRHYDNFLRVGNGAGVPVLPRGEWERFLGDLHSALTTTADRLSALPPPELLPLVQRPDEAKLRDHMSAEAMTGQLDRFITQTTALRDAALVGAWPGPFGADWSLDGDLLDGFVTKEIRDRFTRATAGFDSVARWNATDIAPDSHARIYLAYVAIALNYLTEVREHMDKYARDSGQKPGDQIMVHVDKMSHSSVTVKSTIRDIITTLAPVADRGDTGLADAIKALTEAIRQDPDLAEDDRKQLLHHVEDIAEAAAEPGEERKRSRAKAALGAVTEAAKSAAQLAQTVNTWHDVLGKLF